MQGFFFLMYFPPFDMEHLHMLVTAQMKHSQVEGAYALRVQ
jgi:hypothetical protein